MARPQKTKWNSLDWRLPNKVLAAQTGAASKLISKWRAKLKAPKSFQPARKLKGFVDFEKTNKQLAAEHGISRKYVANLRRKWGVRKSPDSNEFGPARTRDWSVVDWNLPVRSIAKRMTCSPSTVSRMRRQFGLPPKLHHLNNKPSFYL